MYQARLIAGGAGVVAQGKTDHEAITLAVADSKTVRETNPFAVAVVVSYLYANGPHVLYSTTLGRYRLDVA